jgi:hypothetical protein
MVLFFAGVAIIVIRILIVLLLGVPMLAKAGLLFIFISTAMFVFISTAMFSFDITHFGLYFVHFNIVVINSSGKFATGVSLADYSWGGDRDSN